MSEPRLKWGDQIDNVVSCFNQKGEHIGYLKYERVGSHMHWCWHQFTYVMMSPGCLDEVREKQKELWRLKRDGKS